MRARPQKGLEPVFPANHTVSVQVEQIRGKLPQRWLHLPLELRLALSRGPHRFLPPIWDFRLYKSIVKPEIRQG